MKIIQHMKMISKYNEMIVKCFCSNVYNEQGTQNSEGSDNGLRLALKVMYIGQNYAGMQYQEHTSNTIEHKLFRALTTARLIEDRKTCNFTKVSRTDIGVSAAAQIICFDVNKECSKCHKAFSGLERKSEVESTESSETHEEGTADWLDSSKLNLNLHHINYFLPENIQVIAWAVVPKDFSSRTNIAFKVYKMWFTKDDLDIELISKACKKFEGIHDFRNFSKLVYKTSYLCHIKSAMVEGCKDDPRMAVFTVTGNRFLMHQIRYMMGILHLIGLKKEEPEVIDEMLDVIKNPTKPPYRKFLGCGLCLHETIFEPAIKWRYTTSSYGRILLQLKQTLRENLIQTAVVQGLLNQLENAELETDDGGREKIYTEQREERPYKSIMLQERGSTVAKVQWRFKKKLLRKKLIRNPDAELDSEEEQILRENPELGVEGNDEREKQDLGIEDLEGKIPENIP